MLGGGATSCLSGAQRVTAAAIFESGYVALAEIVNEVRFLRQLKSFMMSPIESEIEFYEDNEGGIEVANDSFSSRRVQHTDIKNQIVRETVDE